MQMVDMARQPEKEQQESPVMPNAPIYPYGLCISLSQDELEKLNLEPECQVGDMIHLLAMAKVTSISQYETTESANCRIELQITHLGLEDEDSEYVKRNPKRKLNFSRLYEG